MLPKLVSEQDVRESARFRARRRFPSVVWRSTRTGAVLVRSAQIEMGIPVPFISCRNKHDEHIIARINDAAFANRPNSNATSAAAAQSSAAAAPDAHTPSEHADANTSVNGTHVFTITRATIFLTIFLTLCNYMYSICM